MQIRNQSTAAIDRWLQKSSETDQNKKSKHVNIREVIVCHPEGVYGEYNGYHFYDNHNRELESESSEHFVNRVIKHIHEIAIEAIAVHRKNNFNIVTEFIDGIEIKKHQLRHSKRHEITRLSFPEFYFYPYKSSRPLSLAVFNIFLQRCAKLGEDYPDNFHLILGTLPVEDEAGIVHNFGVYIQCGKQSQLNVFAKANPHIVDKKYSETISPLMAGGSLEGTLSDDIDDALDELHDNIQEGQLSETKELIAHLESICLSNKDYIYKNNDEDNKAYCYELQQLLMMLDTVKRHLDSGKTWHNAEVKHAMKMLSQLGDSYIRRIKAKEKKYFAKTAAKITKKKISSTQFRHDKEGGWIIQYGGSIHCKTAGGIQFTTYVDICYDTRIGVAQLLQAENIRDQMVTFSDRVVRLSSQVVISNTTILSKKRLIGKSVTHVDPLIHQIAKLNRGTGRKSVWEKLQHDEAIEFESTNFGKSGFIYLFKPHRLERTTKHAKLIRYYHHQLKIVKRLQLWQRKFPEDHTIANDINTIKLLVMCRLGEVSAARKLLDANADYDYLDYKGYSAKHYALRHAELIELLIERNVSFDNDIKEAVAQQSSKVAKLYTAHIASNQTFKVILELNRDSSPRIKSDLLSVAIKAKRVNDVNYLLSIGADPLCENTSHQLPYKKVLKYYDTEVFRALYDHMSAMGCESHLVSQLNADTPHKIREEMILLAIEKEQQVAVQQLVNATTEVFSSLETFSKIISAGFRWQNMYILADVYVMLSYLGEMATMMVSMNVDKSTDQHVKAMLLQKAQMVDDKDDVAHLLLMGANPALKLETGKSAIGIAVKHTQPQYLEKFYEAMCKKNQRKEFFNSLPNNIPERNAQKLFSFLKHHRDKKLLSPKVKALPTRKFRFGIC